MTRKKWNRLRRQHPHLFKLKASWESLAMFDQEAIRKMGKGEVLARFAKELLTRTRGW